ARYGRERRGSSVGMGGRGATALTRLPALSEVLGVHGDPVARRLLLADVPAARAQPPPVLPNRAELLANVVAPNGAARGEGRCRGQGAHSQSSRKWDTRLEARGMPELDGHGASRRSTMASAHPATPRQASAPRRHLLAPWTSQNLYDPL